MAEVRRPRTLDPLNYSDGEQYSISRRIPSGPTPAAASRRWSPPTTPSRPNFVNWANANGYRQVELQDGTALVVRPDRAQHRTGLFDVNRSGSGERLRAATTTTSTATATCPTTSVTRTPTASPTTTSPTGACCRPTGTAATRARSRTTSTTRAPTSPMRTATATACATVRTTRTTTTSRTSMELSRIAASGLDDRKTGKNCVPKDGLGGGNFSVSGGPLPDGALLVTFENELGNRDVAEMTASGAGLTGGSSPAVDVDTARQGGGGRRRAADGDDQRVARRAVASPSASTATPHPSSPTTRTPRRWRRR